MKEWWKPEYPEKTPGDELKKMTHTKGRRFKPQLEYQFLSHWYDSMKIQAPTGVPIFKSLA